MKKLSIIILLLIISISTQAQFLRFGLKAGVNFADLNGISDYKTKTGFHFGGLVEVKLLQNLSVQAELIYSFQGAKANGQGFNDINYNYITVPVLAKFYLITERLSLEAGPQFAFLVNNNVDFDNPKTFDFAVDGGLDFNFTQHVFGQARYVAGLTDTSKDATVKNRVIQLSLGYRF